MERERDKDALSSVRIKPQQRLFVYDSRLSPTRRARFSASRGAAHDVLVLARRLAQRSIESNAVAVVMHDPFPITRGVIDLSSGCVVRIVRDKMEL